MSNLAPASSPKGRGWLVWLLIFLIAVALLALVIGTARNNQNVQVAQSPVVQQQTVMQSSATATLITEPTPTEVIVPPNSFQIPFLKYNFPDPQIIYVNGVYYAYATNGSGRNVQAATSTDLLNWELLTDAMPALPAWVKLSPSDVWAPEVIQIGQRYVMYYTARDKPSGKQSIGVAIGDHPESKF